MFSPLTSGIDKMAKRALKILAANPEKLFPCVSPFYGQYALKIKHF